MNTEVKYANPNFWLFNPWTSQRRDTLDVVSDPYGLLMLPPGEPIYAAPKTKADAQQTSKENHATIS